MLGGTILNLTEKPYTKKANSGDGLSQHHMGLDIILQSNLLTRLIFCSFKNQRKVNANCSRRVCSSIPGQAAIGENGTAMLIPGSQE